jgi:GxxExxY protein
MEHEDITEHILAASFEVMHEIGHGFLESVYERSLIIALQSRGLIVKSQVPIEVMFRKHIVGEFFADLLVENKVIVELKAAKALAPEHQAQVINYLNATGIEVGLLINFGAPKMDYHRLVRKKDFQPTTTRTCPF